MEGELSKYNALKGLDKKLDEALDAFIDEPKMKAWRDQMMTKYDANKNGALDHDEYMEFHKYL